MKKADLLAKIHELETRIAQLEMQAPAQMPVPQWVPLQPVISPGWPAIPNFPLQPWVTTSGSYSPQAADVPPIQIYNNH